jgi:hypothetical protein
MKFAIALNLLVAVTLAAGHIMPTLYNSIVEFKRMNPETKLIKMKVVDFGPSASRTYYIGQRQTGRMTHALIMTSVTHPEQIP